MLSYLSPGQSYKAHFSLNAIVPLNIKYFIKSLQSYEISPKAKWLNLCNHESSQ